MTEGFDYIVCPVCNKHYRNLKLHVTKSHKEISWNDLKEENPGLKSICDDFLNNRKEVMRDLNTRPEFIKKRQEAQSRPNKIAAAIRTIQKVNDNYSEEMREAARQRMIKLNKSELMKEKNRSKMLKRHEDPEFTQSLARHGRIGHRSSFILPNGRTVTLRSNLERTIIEYLSEVEDDFDYESIVVKYTIDNYTHNYIPDVILHNNIILEIKPKCLQSGAVVQSKKKACEDSGYKFFFVSSVDELKEILLNL